MGPKRAFKRVRIEWLCRQRRRPFTSPSMITWPWRCRIQEGTIRRGRGICESKIAFLFRRCTPVFHVWFSCRHLRISCEHEVLKGSKTFPDWSYKKIVSGILNLYSGWYFHTWVLLDLVMIAWLLHSADAVHSMPLN